MSNNIEQKDCYGLNDEFYIGKSNTQLKDLPSGRLLAIGVITTNNGSIINVGTTIGFADGKMGDKTYNILNFGKKDYLIGTYGKILVQNLDDISMVEAFVTINGLGKKIWFWGNQDALPEGISLLAGTGQLLYGGESSTERSYGGSSNLLIFKVNANTGNFYVNPSFAPYSGDFTPSIAGTKSQLIVKVYSR